MASILMDVLKPEIDERVNTAVDNAVNKNNNTRTNLYLYVQRGGMSVDFAAQEAGMTITDFSNAMVSAGYTVPQNTQNAQNSAT